MSHDADKLEAARREGWLQGMKDAAGLCDPRGYTGAHGSVRRRCRDLILSWAAAAAGKGK